MTEQTQATRADDTQEWGVRFEAALAMMLRQYLDGDPPPSDSAIGRDAGLWLENLDLRAEARRMGRTEETPRRAA